MSYKEKSKYCFSGSLPQIASLKIQGDLNGVQVYTLNDLTFMVCASDVDRPEGLIEQLAPNFTEFHGPLKRIFKKPGSKVSEEDTAKARRLVLSLNLVQDPKLLEEYIAIHRPGAVWPEVIENMNTMGVFDMELYLQGYRVFMIMEVREDFDMEAEAAHWERLPREKEWQNYVSKFQRIDENGKTFEKWRVMKPINKDL